MDFIRKYLPGDVYQRVEGYLQGVEFLLAKSSS